MALGRQLHPVPAHSRRAATEVWHDLLDASVLVRDCSTWPGLDDCLRVTVGTPAENDRFLAALRLERLADADVAHDLDDP